MSLNNASKNIYSVVISSEVEKLGEEIAKLKVELSMLLLEHDSLLYNECPNIEMLYMLKLGALEYQVFNAENEYLRLKRKVELLQAKKNRQEEIVESEIDMQVEEEFQVFKKQLEDMVEKMDKAIHRSKGNKLSVDESQELKKLYREIIKIYHDTILNTTNFLE